IVPRRSRATNRRHIVLPRLACSCAYPREIQYTSGRKTPAFTLDRQVPRAVLTAMKAGPRRGVFSLHLAVAREPGGQRLGIRIRLGALERMVLEELPCHRRQLAEAGDVDVRAAVVAIDDDGGPDRKSTRLNSSH